MVQRVHHFAVHVKLKLVGGRIADTHRLRVLVAIEPRHLAFRQPSLALTTYMIWSWSGLPAAARSSQSRHARASS
jgi:hypothetical protein